MPVPFVALANHLALQCLQSCEQGGGAVAFVIMGHGAPATGDKLLSKSDKIQQCGFCEAALPEEVVSVIIDESLLTVPWLRHLASVTPTRRNIARSRRR